MEPSPEQFGCGGAESPLESLCQGVGSFNTHLLYFRTVGSVDKFFFVFFFFFGFV